MKTISVWLLSSALLCSACVDGDPPRQDPVPLTRLEVDRTYLRDAHGRYVFFHGVNLSGSTKVPTAIGPDGVPTYVGKPFDLDDADLRFRQIRAMGFNVVRLLLIWEAIEPTAPGVYDMEYLAFIRQIVQKANEHHVYVLLDMHQDMFSRHLSVKYNNAPAEGEPGSLESSLLSLVPDASGQYNDSLQGDGAPRWAVEACLQEKDLDSPNWGTPRILSGLNLEEVERIWGLIQRLLGQDVGEIVIPDWVGTFLAGLPGPFPVNETTDLLPMTNWTLAYLLSLDLARCYGCLFAGDTLFPGLERDGLPVKEYLQSAYAGAWAQVAAVVADLPNVIGYDLMNEPGSFYILLTAVGALIQTGAVSAVQTLLVDLLGDVDGQDLYDTLVTLKLLPPDTEPETLAEWGLDKLDALAAVGLNANFDAQFTQPFYERVGQAILAVDPQAVIFIESTSSFENLFGDSPGGGILGQWENPMTHPAGLPQVVYAPHWYPDIYPELGFNVAPRAFSPDEVRHRDYTDKLERARALAAYSLGNIPVVFGEFGTYFNYNGIDRAREQDYLVSAHILDNYYEAFEAMFQSNMLWCYSPENDYVYGDGWNHEDFSVIDPAFTPRAREAWSRPYAAALAGKPISTHYLSPLHYFDPDKGEVDRVGEFELVYGSKETAAPTEIVIPDKVYPDGFYVWVSDGLCHYDPARQILYHLPGRDEPGAEHWLRILPPLRGQEQVGWRYFFRGDQVLTR